MTSISYWSLRLPPPALVKVYFANLKGFSYIRVHIKSDIFKRSVIGQQGRWYEMFTEYNRAVGDMS